MNLLIKLLITAVAAYALTFILPGVNFNGGFTSAIGFAIVLGLLNIFVKPIFKVLGFPLTILTLGLFSLVINAVTILIADYFIDGLVINGFWWALLFSILLSFLTSILEGIFTSDKK